MPVKKIKPVTAGTRHRIANTFEQLTASTPEKSLTFGISSSGGRNNQGRRSMRQMGGGHKRKLRIIDFKRTKDGVPAVVKSIEYDPNRSAFIALLAYADGEKAYIIAPNKLQVGATVMSGKSATPDVGNTLFLADVPFGTNIHAIEMTPGKGAALARSAGTYGQVVGRDGKYVVVKLPSGETRLILNTCRATIGSTSNPDHNLQQLGKAGRNRWLGRRPRTRGVAMNPVDHPMGGGEGRASGGHPRSRTGLKSKGYKTRTPKKASNRLIISKRK
jgi:large subunit ribosomal protein L2